MATSGTVGFRPDVEEILTEAFERCGLDPQTMTGDRSVSARRSLNLLFSEWANRGINYWTVTQNTLTLVDGQTAYTLPAGTIDIMDAVIRDSSGTDTSDQSINRVSISDYNQLPNKTSAGKPSQYMLDKQYTPVVYLWQVPNTTTYSMIYWAVNQLEDVTASNQDADIPYRWNECICAGLASKISLKYATEKFSILNEMYERAFAFAAASDNDGVKFEDSAYCAEFILMARYASGKKSQAISDISGLRVPYTKLRTTWDGLRVSPEDFDPKQPQLTPAKNVVDATALFNPRPDTDPENVVVYIGFTQDWTIDPRLLPPVGVPSIGTVGYVNLEITSTQTGVGGTGAVGTETLEMSINEVWRGWYGRR
jgi:hypothetical protein